MLQIKSTLLISAILFAVSAGQVFGNWNNERYMALRILFLIVGIFAFVVLAMLAMDLSRKDFKEARGVVHSRHRNQVWVKLDNGKHKSCVIAAEQNPESFTEGRPVKLMLGRRSRMVHRIDPLAK